MLKSLRRKIWGDLRVNRGQFFAVWLVVTLGTAFYGAMYPAGVNMLNSLYATYDGVIRATGARRISVPLHTHHAFRMQSDDIEKAITPQSRVLLLNNPHNPTGANLSADEVAAIGAVCRKHDLTIVSDEVYEDLIYDGVFTSPFDDDDLADRTIVVSSISKSHAAPGFRSGWAVREVAAKAYPGLATTPETVQRAEQALADDLPAPLRRALLDGTDKLSRAVRSLARFAKMPE